VASEADPGYGPPPGSPTAPARGAAGELPFRAIEKEWMSGTQVPKVDDPAFTSKIVDATDANTRARAKLIYRDLPLVTIQNTWSIDQARGAIYSHLAGVFYASGLLCDSILGDDRVCATLNSRAAGVFGREVRFKPADDSAAARECCDAWEAWWPRLAPTPSFREVFDYDVMMGFGHAQICWDTTQPRLDFAPSVFPWHPVFTWYDWMLRCYQAIGQDAQIPIIPGNGKWLQLGGYRSWVRGCLRPVVEPWMLRHFGFRDMARFGEIHGNPTRKGYVPMVGDPVERKNFEQALAGLGANTTIMIPRGIDPQNLDGYDYDLTEATSQAWQVHPSQIDRCDMAIVLAILMQNLTTQVDGGSYGAAKVHMDIKSQGAEMDNQRWAGVIYRDLARPFAYLNHGDANLAPMTWWDVTPVERYESNAKQLVQFGTAVEVLRRGGIEFEDVDEVRRWASERFGLTGLPKFKIVQPVSAGGGGVPPPGKGQPPATEEPPGKEQKK
jgi:hypothetical protein